MSDTEIRQAERAGDTLRVMRLRHRAGLCPLCGVEPTEHGWAEGSRHFNREIGLECCGAGCYRGRSDDGSHECAAGEAFSVSHCAGCPAVECTEIDEL